jgi:prepilin-type N-terminal cleavage/methylation domain-containing protein
MQRNQHGFTLIEITAVLVLMAIISAYVIGRSVNTAQIDLAAQTDRVRNQIRYVQAAAMKRSDRIWGIKCDTSTNQYWLFSVQTPVTANAEDQADNQITFPGERNKKISLADLGIDDMTGFTLFFDRIGKPYNVYVDEGDPGNAPLNSDLVINVSAGSLSRNITVIPETGLTQ